jgi:hypothetical protein
MTNVDRNRNAISYYTEPWLLASMKTSAAAMRASGTKVMCDCRSWQPMRSIGQRPGGNALKVLEPLLLFAVLSR